MPFYSGCSLIVAIPQDYARKDDLTQFLSSKLDGCEISVLEDVEAKKPFPLNATIKETSQLKSLQGTRDFDSPDKPATEETSSVEFLMGAAGEAIHDFLESSGET
jgi:hypothetical protein